MSTPALPSESELVELAALISDRPHASPSTRLTDDQPFLDKLDYHGITLLAADKNRLPASLANDIAQRRANMVANDTLKQRALIELFDAFHASGLEQCVLFKGAALAYSLYRQPWLRPRSDHDCLIDYKDYPAFAEILTSLGYNKLFATEGRYVSYQSTFSKPLAGRSVMNIDLHWRINNRQCLANVFTAAELKHRGRPLDTLSANITIPCKIDSLLIASLHRLGHHQAEERLAWLYDVHILAEQLSSRDWDTLAREARAKQICLITLDALRTCERFFATQIPAATLNHLGQAKAEPSRIFLQRNLPEWRYFVSDLRALKSPLAQLRLIQEHVLPNPQYVRQQMETRSALLGYGKRLIRGLKRVITIG